MNTLEPAVLKDLLTRAANHIAENRKLGDGEHKMLAGLIDGLRAAAALMDLEDTPSEPTAQLSPESTPESTAPLPGKQVNNTNHNVHINHYVHVYYYKGGHDLLDHWHYFVYATSVFDTSAIDLRSTRDQRCFNSTMHNAGKSLLEALMTVLKHATERIGSGSRRMFSSYGDMMISYIPMLECTYCGCADRAEGYVRLDDTIRCPSCRTAVKRRNADSGFNFAAIKAMQNGLDGLSSPVE